LWLNDAPRHILLKKDMMFAYTDLPDVVLAFHVHGACLRPHFPGFFTEMDRISDLQFVKFRVQDTVAVKIDLPTIRAFDETVVLPG
jgi:hypothetical protein